MEELESDCSEHIGYQKLILLQLIGEIYGHHTLTGLLSSVGINPCQGNKKWQKLSYKTIWSWLEKCIRNEFKSDFELLLKQSDSSWSRQNITAIGDESVFRQWLCGESRQKDVHYQKSFSGQFCKSVWGYKMSVWGVMMNDRFYPLVIKCLKSVETCVSIAEKCVDELANFLNDISNGYGKPKLFFSIDSGFNNVDLLNKIETKGFVPICVPKDSHRVFYENKNLNIKELKVLYEQKEQKYFKKSKDKDCFCWRIRVTYQMHKRESVFILFRLKGSKKVSAAFCFDLEVKAKTIRRHWFARTSIEQFFRLMKTTLRIQESVSSSYEGFIKKFSVTCLKACFILQIRNRVRKTVRGMKRAT